ncbi:ankyrin repeat-containing protein At5g02620-like [Triticum dicoccoides]|uniref:ankyrin repeat-containing protein At5g02620-like n=1 Tax=Triticum dicoccoides TaxID=85692 RepID=UPI00188F2C12|nr:ankyrin repeat-containing protein At5g02620-like [Triticum dicoccoides]
MASSSAHPRDPTSAPVEGIVASRPTVVIHPELLRAARRGDYEGLKILLHRENGAVAATAEQIVVEVRDSAPASGTPALLPQSTRAVAVAVADQPLPSSSPPLLAGGVTFQGDSALHVVAASGDGPAFVKCAGLIYQEAKHLLDGPNNNGDTPLHCAARAGHGAVVSRLIALAGHEQGGDERAKDVLTRLNGRRETVLHDAVRIADEELVCELMSTCPLLARFPGDGTSALYLAISLGHDRIVDLLHSKDPELSYSGPAGQNALHAASLHGREMTQKILEWSNKEGNNAIIGHADESGSTPLHFAASAEGREMEEASSFVTRFLFRRPVDNPTPIHLLLDADQCSACRPDNRGQYPIHIAASMGKLGVVALILDKCPECAGLRDARGRTFLHVAINMRRENIVDYATKDQRFESILNMQDNGGNTALHLAVQVGVLRIFRDLLRNRHVSLNMANDKGQTPADLSRSTIPAGLYYKTNARMWILWSLVKANARNGNDRRDHFQEKHILKLDESKESKKMTEAAQMTGIGSVLVATMAFAAAVTMPGGYIASEHKNGGTPTLAGSYAFDAFMYAVAVAFICSMLATFSLMYSGMATVDWKIRNNYFNDSLGWMWNSSRSLLAAFALGVYLVLAPVAGTTAVGVCILTSGTLLFRNREVGRILICTYTLHKRLGIFIWVRLATSILPIILQSYFVYIVIFFSPVCFHGILKHFPILGASK